MPLRCVNSIALQIARFRGRDAVIGDQPTETITSPDPVTLGAVVLEVTARSPRERG